MKRMLVAVPVLVLVSTLFMEADSAQAANGFIATLPQIETDPRTGEITVLARGNIDNSDAAGTKDGTQTEYEEEVAAIGIGVGDFVSFTVNPTTGLAEGIAAATPQVPGSVIDTDTVGDQTVGPGEICTIKNGATLTGNIRVDGGTIRVTEASTVVGNIKSKNGGTIEIIGSSTVDGNIKSRNPTNSVTITDATVTGNVRILGATGPVAITGSTLKRNVRVKDGSGSVNISNNSIGANLRVKRNSGGVTLDTNIIEAIAGGTDPKHNLRVVENSGAVTVTNNTVDQNLRAFKNTGSTTINTNTVYENLRVRENTATVGVDGNTVSENLRLFKNSSTVTVNNNTVSGNLRARLNGGTTNITNNNVTENLRARDNNHLTVTGNTVGGNLKITGTTGTCTDSGNTVAGTSMGCGSGKTIASETEESVPGEISLFQNHPNPSNPATEIRFALPEAGHVVLSIYNPLGEEVRTLVSRPYAAGYHTVRWDGKDTDGHGVSSGVYFYRLRAGGSSKVHKMTLLQ